MVPLNPIMLFGLAAVAIPIIIHILNRRRARVVDWGAMQFLEESLASRNRRILIEEIILMAIRCMLLAAVALAMARPFLTGRRILPGEGRDAQDIALIVDGSLSMTLESEGKSNFQRAIEEARQVVRTARKSDAISLLLAGPSCQAVIPSPISDREKVLTALAEMTPTGGSMAALEALHAGTLSVKTGTNPAKKIVLITDGQELGWDLTAEKRWSFLAAAGEHLPTRPAVIVRTLEPPRRWTNAAVTNVTFSRAVIGTDREVQIAATITNTGVGPITIDAAELSVDGKVAGQVSRTEEIAEAASTTVTFQHRFEVSGPHVVTVRLIGEDDLAGDNGSTRVVNIVGELPVLILAGHATREPLKGDADFLEIAAAPPAEKAGDKTVAHVIRPRVVAAADVAGVTDVSAYSAVVLANVPVLPGAKAAMLADYVRAGGGLLVAPGEKASGDFYNEWRTPDGSRVLGCRLERIHTDRTTTQPEERFAHVAPNTIDHPALLLLSDPEGSDLATARLRRHWLSSIDSKDKAVTVGAGLDTGDAFLIEHRCGKGLVLTLTVPLSREFSDLPVKKSYVPLVHELLYHLAAPGQRPMNLLPGEPFVYDVPGAIRDGDVAEVIAPDAARQPARLERRGDRWQAGFSLTARPGLYRLTLPDAALGELATRPGLTATRAAEGAEKAPVTVRGVPFLVLGDPQESRLKLLADEDYHKAGTFVSLARAATLAELTAAIEGSDPGSEVWKVVAAIALALLVGEVLTTRYIAAKRRAHLATRVAFGAEQVNADEFRSAAREALEAPAGQRTEVSAK